MKDIAGDGAAGEMFPRDPDVLQLFLGKNYECLIIDAVREKLLLNKYLSYFVFFFYLLHCLNFQIKFAHKVIQEIVTYTIVTKK